MPPTSRPSSPVTRRRRSPAPCFRLQLDPRQVAPGRPGRSPRRPLRRPRSRRRAGYGRWPPARRCIRRSCRGGRFRGARSVRTLPRDLAGHAGQEPQDSTAETATRLPMSESSTPGPTASTTPACSVPSTCGKFLTRCANGGRPARVATSFVRATAIACTRMRTSPAVGSGVGTSARCNTSGPPNSVITKAFTTSAPSREGSTLRL